MKNYKKLVLASFIALFALSTPALSFAKNIHSELKGENGKKVGFELALKKNNGNENSWLRKFMNVFSFNYRWSEGENENENGGNKNQNQSNYTGNPVISSLVGATSLKVGGTETVTVRTYDPANRALTYSIDWGDGSTKDTVTKTTGIHVATLTHTYSTVGTYTITATITSSDGKTATTTMSIVVSAQATDTTAPVISNIGLLINSSSQVTISWKTDELANSKIFYSTTTPVDTSTSNTNVVSSTTMTKDHSLSISNITPQTLYHFVIKSSDSSSNEGTSSEYVFMTN